MSSAPRKTLLIVDDSRVSRMMIRSLVTAHRPQWTIHEAVSGDEALRIVAESVPDHITMDINMPGTMGTDVAERISHEHPGLRMVLFSANVQDSHQSRARSMGAKFVAKPVNEKSVLQALNFFDEGL
ncbi:response regulator transcription factor [Pseudorhodoferax sp. Leaf267]|uniref:response regulator transcription factor n=1 Tax=Pseudorhodoferax sp. Leaf267 TaxID=1736316 RepID=UPI000701C4A3|nr:response regulator [Pseudorhodoferax sp. Leaf267]KQP22919.1 response regulator receiver protein [Pseudorhodoferax sp. Leaf267]